MRNAFVGIIVAATVLLAAGTTVRAQSDPIAGTWGISTSGEAAIGAATSGSCKVTGTVPAGLYDALFDFGNGQIVIHNLGINIGATNCTSPNFQGTGRYTVGEKGNGGFEVNGTFTTQFVGRPAPCSGTALNSVSFTALGKTGENTMTITINGLGSGAYAEGPPPGPLTCRAPILNLTASGSGKKF